MSYFNNLNPNNMLHSLTPDNVLHAVGLRRESEARVLTDTVLPSLAVFSAGVLLGAAIALLVTPKSGRELRHDLSRKAGELGDTVREKLPALRADATEHAYAGRTNPNPTL